MPRLANAAGNAAEDAGSGLREFLARARARARLRLAAAAAFDVVVGAAAAVVLAAWSTGGSLRGDLVAPAALALGGLAALARGLALGLGLRRLSGWLQVARAIARHRGSLAASSGGPDADLDLRREILGATELWLAERSGELRGSPELARRYVAQIGARVRALPADPRRGLAEPRLAGRAALAAAVTALALAGLHHEVFSRGLALLRTASDGRPPEPPVPVWTTLRMQLEYPAHTRRPPRTLEATSGALDVPAGTTVTLALTPSEATEAGRVQLAYDGEDAVGTPAPELVPLQREGEQLAGSFVVRGTGSWAVLLSPDEDDLDDDVRRSAPAPIHVEPDRPPEIDLRPLPADRREADHEDEVTLLFHARDDFGLHGAELAYQIGEGPVVRLPIARPAGADRNWNGHHRFDLSAIALKERSDVAYWIEVRDNDPGLGLVPLPSPPGKVTRSATMHLVVHDEEAEHAANIASLLELRDRAVDLLAARTVGPVYGAEPVRVGDPAELQTLIAEVHQGTAALLAAMATTIEALALDALVRPPEVDELAGIHGRLLPLHRREQALVGELPVGEVARDTPGFRALLGRLRTHDRREVVALEDEIIRLDDLADAQLVKRLEGLLAAVAATQQKLVELLEQLEAGDESVRAQIDQLLERRREDMRRVAELRRMLAKEIGDPGRFMNVDAFEAMRKMAEAADAAERLARGDVDGALEQAQKERDQLRQLRDALQERLVEPEGEARLSPEDVQRLELLRELSRLQDQEGTLRDRTRALDRDWRKAVGERGSDARAAAAATAEELGNRLGRINDARLGRDAREGLRAAMDALADLQARGRDPATPALGLLERTESALDGLRRAVEGSEASEREGAAVREQTRTLERLAEGLRRELPDPSAVLEDGTAERISGLRGEQTGLGQRTAEILRSPAAEILPDEGRRALREAQDRMQDGATGIGRERTTSAVREQSRAWDAIGRAIDSLRRSSAAPPPPSGGDASTDAERDRSLRDELLESMKSGAPRGFADAVKRYYEELLR